MQTALQGEKRKFCYKIHVKIIRIKNYHFINDMQYEMHSNFKDKE